MNPEVVDSFANGKLEPLSGRSHRGTHTVSKGGTTVWLDFADEELQSAQVTWLVRFTLVDAKPPVYLCERKVHNYSLNPDVHFVAAG